MPQRFVEIDGVTHEFPADATDQEISAVLKAPPVTARGPKARTWVDMAVDALPAVGGAVGGAIGGLGGTVMGMGIGAFPGAIGGAAVGGAGGEGFRQAINALRGQPIPTPSQQAIGMGREAVTQAAGELTGRGVMKGASMAAHGLMDFAIRPAPTVAEEFGDIAATALKERLPVGSILPGGTTGSALARQAMRESAGTTRTLLDTAGTNGARLSPAAMARGPVSEMAGQIAKQPLSDSELNHVARLFAEYLDTHPGDMAPVDVKDMKQAAQRIAKPIFKALNAGNVPPAGDALKAQFNKAIADGAKAALEALPDVGNAVGASEARTQGLIGASKAIRRSESRRLPLIAEMAAPLAGAVAGGSTGKDAKGMGEGAAEGVTVAVLTRALLSPRTTSRAALGLTNPVIQQTLRQLPRATIYALLEQVTEARTPAEDTPSPP